MKTMLFTGTKPLKVVVDSEFLGGMLGSVLGMNYSRYTYRPFLVGGFNPFEKYDRQIGSFGQVGIKIKKIETTTR